MERIHKVFLRTRLASADLYLHNIGEIGCRFLVGVMMIEGLLKKILIYLLSVVITTE